MRRPLLPFSVAPRLDRVAFPRVLEQLREGRPGESAYGRREALLLTIPASDDPIAWDIRRSIENDAYIVRTIWRRSLDASSLPHRATRAAAGAESLLGAFGLGRPTLSSTRLGIDGHALDALLAALRSAFLPCAPPRGRASADATIFEVTLGHELSETRFRWSGNPPRGWAPLADFASGILRLVDHELSQSLR